MSELNVENRIATGISNLDNILFGGLPAGSLTVIAGVPGGGKTILSQQIVMKNASPTRPGVFFQTLSEPTAKTLRYLKGFSYFDPEKLSDGSIHFVDLGAIMRSKGLADAVSVLMEHVKRLQPAFVVIDSFRVFEDLSNSEEDLRKFTYEVAINMMAWETTTFLLGEFSTDDIASNPLFSIVDGIIHLTLREEFGEQKRFIQVSKLRGTDHNRDEHSFAITKNGLEVYAPRVTIRRETTADLLSEDMDLLRTKTGIPSLDDLLGEGIPYGSSVLISGVAGTGKTLLSLEFIYRGAAEFGEKGLFISFEETSDRLIADARKMGWDIAREIEEGRIEIIFVPQTDILVEKDLLMIHQKINNLGAKRVAIDSISIFVHKVNNPQLVRDKIFQLATLVQRAQAVGFFITDIPYGSKRISRYGVEETVVDGVILLSSVERSLKRERFAEVYKLRNTAHSAGKHPMVIGANGIEINPNDPGVVKSKKKKQSRSARSR